MIHAGLVSLPTVDISIPTSNRFSIDRLLQKDKVVIVMGATGTGKSRLSIDLATQFRAEVINSDKMQVYEGLDIATNKITEEEQRGIPHHLLGVVNPNSDFTAADFRYKALRHIKSIHSRRRLPIIVGGSNSYIEALVDDQHSLFRSLYECYVLWVDVSIPVLYQFVSDRVDKMIENGLVDEVRDFFDPDADYSRGIRRAIGVPEFDSYFRAESSHVDNEIKARVLREAIEQIKNNTCKLACRQLEKIHRLRNKGWKIHRIDATEVFRRRGVAADEAWNKLVAGPSSSLVAKFLSSDYYYSQGGTYHQSMGPVKDHMKCLVA